MSDPRTRRIDEISIQTDQLCLEETFTDQAIGTIRRLSPVKPDGSPDPSRAAQFIGQTHIMTGMGPVPLDIPIDATHLAEAIRKFPEAAKLAVDRMVEEVKEMQRREASRIVTPDELAGGMGPRGGFGPPAGGGRGGPIVLK